MNNNLLKFKIKQRLNKLDSQDSDNINCWQIQEAVNKALNEWVRRQLHGGNTYKEGVESSTRRIDDLNVLLSTIPLSGTNKPLFYETEHFPKDYMEFSKIDVYAKSECCIERKIYCYTAEEVNSEILLSDYLTSPNFDWAETFRTLHNSHFKIYTNNKFEITRTELTYYRQPRQIVFADCFDVISQEESLVDVECEFKDDVVELIIDDAVSILAGDINDQYNQQRGSQNSEKNN